MGKGPGLNVLAIGSNLIEGRENIGRTREAEQLEAAKCYDAPVRFLRHNVTGTVVGRVMLSLPGKNVPADQAPIERRPSLFYWDTAAGLGFQPEAHVDFRLLP